jgi:chromosome partitioning protein
MFINIKGGVAKTTNAVAVAQFLAEAGNRVLLIDADHQCAAGELVLGESRLDRCERRGSTLHDLMSEMVKDEFSVETLADYLASATFGKDVDDSADLSVLPCSLRIDDYQRNYNSARREFGTTQEFGKTIDRRLRRVRQWLQSNFDYTIIDCPPSLPIHVQMLVKVADAYIVPCIPDMLSIRGASYLVDRLRRKQFKIQGLGTLWSLFRKQDAVHRDKIELAQRRMELFPGMPKPFDTIIPNAAAIARALVRQGETLSAGYSPPFAGLFRDLVGEIEERCRKLPSPDGERRRIHVACI